MCVLKYGLASRSPCCTQKKPGYHVQNFPEEVFSGTVISLVSFWNCWPRTSKCPNSDSKIVTFSRHMPDVLGCLSQFLLCTYSMFSRFLLNQTGVRKRKLFLDSSSCPSEYSHVPIKCPKMPEEDLANMCRPAFLNQCRAWVCAWVQSLHQPHLLTLWLQMGSLGSKIGAWGELAWTRTVFLQTIWIHTVPSTRQLEFKPGFRRGLERQLDTQPVSLYGQTSLRNILRHNFTSTVTFWGLSLSQSISNSVYLLLIWCHSSSFEHMSSGATYMPCYVTVTLPF